MRSILILISILALTSPQFTQTDLISFSNGIFTSLNLSTPTNIQSCFAANSSYPEIFISILNWTYGFTLQYSTGQNFTQAHYSLEFLQSSVPSLWNCIHNTSDWISLTQAINIFPGIGDIGFDMYQWVCGAPLPALAYSTPVAQNFENSDFSGAGEEFGALLTNFSGYYQSNETRSNVSATAFANGFVAALGFNFSQEIADCVATVDGKSVWSWYGFYGVWAYSLNASVKPEIDTIVYFQGIGATFLSDAQAMLKCLSETDVNEEFLKTLGFTMSPFDLTFRAKLYKYINANPQEYVATMQNLTTYNYGPERQNEADFGQYVGLFYKTFALGMEEDIEY